MTGTFDMNSTNKGNREQRSVKDTLNWDDECFLNPHQAAMEKGKADGRQAGRQAGFLEGRSLGRTKGLEFGVEIGFIQGVLDAVELSLDNWDPPAKTVENKRERVVRSVQELKNALKDFPDPHDMFQINQVLSDPSLKQGQRGSDDVDEGGIDGKAGSQYVNDSDSEAMVSREKVDVFRKMQRIRARFKILTVQLGIPHFSLKQVMSEMTDRTVDSHVQNDNSVRNEKVRGGYEW